MRGTAPKLVLADPDSLTQMHRLREAKKDRSLYKGVQTGFKRSLKPDPINDCGVLPSIDSSMTVIPNLIRFERRAPVFTSIIEYRDRCSRDSAAPAAM